MKKGTVALILAGGAGVRMKKVTPKQFLRIAGKPIIVHTLLQFEDSDLISDIIVVCPKNYMDDLKKIIKKNKFKKIIKVVQGGKTRQESSFNGLKSCSPGTKYVLIHDAVRPFVDKRIIKDTLKAAKEAGAATAVVNTDDTIILKKRKFVENVPDRKTLKRVQTPQGFKYKTILDAHEWARKKKIKNATDDCGLVLAKGKPVKVVDGSALNIKLTDQLDFYLAEKLLQMRRSEIKNMKMNK